MIYKLLDRVNSPQELKRLDEREIPTLIDEIRGFLLENIAKTGGHLASNLGVVELSVALHRVFESPSDHIIFDVGHQSYVHKLLTGRRLGFSDLRSPGGMSGFTVMRESVHDAFGAGHSSTSISAALGMAEADALLGRDNYTVAVIGDGAYTGGMVHEALNNLTPDLKLIIILNENGMSISTNKGAFASYLSRVRASKGYLGAKRGTHSALNRIPLLGKPIISGISFVKRVIKKVIFTSNYFEDLGLFYIGPIDGNDYDKLKKALETVKSLGHSAILHIKTVKGKGMPEAELQPDKYHSVKGAEQKSATFHEVAASSLISLAEEDKNIVAITAAMGIGTGLDKFEEKFPDRYFDVGIAEEHALTFSAGLAAGGLKPFAAIYSTFLQRGYDNIIHDIALQNLPVRLLIDRAGIAVSDGATHHGIFDVAFLSHIPGMEILAPITNESLKAALGYAQEATAPVAIRYPNSSENSEVVQRFFTDGYSFGSVRCDFDPENAPKNIIVTYGKEVERAIGAAEILLKQGIRTGIVLIERIKPFDEALELIGKLISEGCHILYAEEGIKNGGAAMITRDKLSDMGLVTGRSFEIAAIDDSFLIPKTVTDIYEYAGLSEVKLAEYFLK